MALPARNHLEKHVNTTTAEADVGWVPAQLRWAEVGMHTAAPLIEGAGLNITLISHGDVMDLSVCVCPDNVPAVNDIATGIVESVGILLAAAEESPRGVSPSVLTEMTSHAKKRPQVRR
jgi:diacylglycerol O-acyltransferase